MFTRSMIQLVFCLLLSCAMWAQCPPDQVILNGGSLGSGVAVGLNTSQDLTNWLSDNGTMLVMQYPAAQAWGTVFFTFGPAVPPGNRSGRDLSGCQSLVVEMMGSVGTVNIGIKDSSQPDDGSEPVVVEQVSGTWQTYTIPLSQFAPTNLKSIYVAAEINFSGPLSQTVYVNNIKYLTSAVPPAISVPSTPLAFSYTIAGATPATQEVAIGGTSGISYTASNGGTTWLSATNGTIPSNMTVSVNPSGLAAGVYSGTITINSVGATGSPATIPVSLKVITPTTTPEVLSVISASAFGAFSTMAPGGWVEIYGTDLAQGTQTWGSADFAGPNAPTMLGGTGVTIGGRSAFIAYVSPIQVNVQVPDGIATGQQPLVLRTAVGDSAPYMVNVVATQPGLLAPSNFNLGGIQYVVAQFADGTYVLPPGAISGLTSNRAKPGDSIVIYGIGFGPVDPTIPPGVVAGQLNTLVEPLQISIGGTEVSKVPYDGLVPNFVGLYQFNLVIPSVPASDTTPLTLILGGVNSGQTLAIAIGN